MIITLIDTSWIDSGVIWANADNFLAKIDSFLTVIVK